jgi:hypothetical protein
MSKFYMMGAAVIAVSVAVVAWGCRPVRTSDDLLGKAQAEFEMKARDALIQRRMTQVAPAPAAPSAPASVPEPTYAVASLEPVVPPTIAAPSAPVVAAAPEAPTVTADSLDAPAASPKLSVPPELPSAPAAEDKKATESQMASQPVPPATENAVTPNPAPAVAPTPEVATVTTPVVTPTVGATPREPVKVTRKTCRASHEPRANVVARRYDRDAARYSMPYNLQALRARAPEIAAAIARYM